MAYRRTRPVYVWIAAIPILLLAASFWRHTHYRELIRGVDHAREVQVAIQNLLVSLNEAETGRRGYILTGDPDYLAAVEGTAARSPAILDRLSDLTRDNPVQQGNVRALESLLNERLQLLEQTSQLGRAGQDAAVRELERQKGLAGSTQLSKVMSAMMAEETRLLDQRKQATEAAEFEADAFFIAGCFATILLLLWAYRILRQYADERDRAESEVRHANERLQEKIGQLDRLNQELENRVKERTADLERSNLDLQQFAFIASHDLQEPLRMVVSYLGLLGKAFNGKLDGDTEKYLAYAVDGATRMQALIRDLLAYAQAGAQTPVLIRTRLSEVVSQARYGLLESVRETGAEISAGALPEVEVDPLKMSLVFQNLFSNAIKFRQRDRKPFIQIEARQEAGEWLVSVHDRGIGFDPKYAEKIFAAFQRLHGKGEYPGTGIGLAICKRIIEAHGGRIWAEGHPGAGATFYFTLPAMADPLPAADDSATASVSSGAPAAENRSREPR
ncbi:MAG: putative multisensor signal transduction histidine kinase [Bryobacterales bacterium]|nr:putative multisensor signal transduction histidine kinase [Bryobacterales bacterium]